MDRVFEQKLQMCCSFENRYGSEKANATTQRFFRIVLATENHRVTLPTRYNNNYNIMHVSTRARI